MVIIYGGSFNPPTIAHAQIADYLIQTYRPTRFVFVPVGNKYSHKTDLAPFHHRKTMLEILSGSFECAVVSEAEDTEDYRGTNHLLDAMKETLGEPVYFVMGADNLQSIDQWIDYKDMVKNHRFLVFRRNKVDVEAIIRNHKYLSAYKDHFFLIDHPIADVSASRYREENEDTMVPDAIHQYIVQNRLYNRGG